MDILIVKRIAMIQYQLIESHSSLEGSSEETSAFKLLVAGGHPRIFPKVDDLLPGWRRLLQWSEHPRQGRTLEERGKGNVVGEETLWVGSGFVLSWFWVCFGLVFGLKMFWVFSYQKKGTSLEDLVKASKARRFLSAKSWVFLWRQNQASSVSSVNPPDCNRERPKFFGRFFWCQAADQAPCLSHLVEQPLLGIFDRENPVNPFRDYTIATWSSRKSRGTCYLYKAIIHTRKR